MDVNDASPGAVRAVMPLGGNFCAVPSSVLCCNDKINSICANKYCNRLFELKDWRLEFELKIPEIRKWH